MSNFLKTARVWALSPRGQFWLVALLLLLPRLVRMAYGQLWIEDEAYLDIALRISHGQVPYRDFPLPHFCLLDAMLGVLFRLFGPSLRTAELLNNAAWWLAALLLYQTLRRAGREGLGLLAALLLSMSSLSFRYHLWEREVLSLPLLAAALLLVFRHTGGKRPLRWLTLLMVLSALIKLTNVVFWIGLGLYLIVAERDWRASLRLWLVAAAGIALVFVAASALAWPEFVQQVFLLHWFKGRNVNLFEKVRQGAYGLDLLVALGVPGFFALWRIERCWAVLVLLWTASTVTFYLFLSPTLWPHNLIDLLIPFALASGATLLFIAETLRELRRNPVFHLSSVALVLTVLWVGLSLKIAAPWRPSLRHRGAVYGFGFQSRREIREVAQGIRRWCRPEEPIVSPGLLAVAANRDKLIAYREIAGEVETIRRHWAEGNLEVFSPHRTRAFFEQIRQEARPWQVEIAEAIKAKRVAAVVIDKGRSHYPYLNVPADFLRTYGYQVVLRTENYDLWSRVP